MRIQSPPTSLTRLSAALALLAFGGLAQATPDDLFVQLSGVTGDVTSPTARAGWIAASDLSWEVQAETSYLKGAGAAVGKANASALSWSQGFDSSMNSLYQTIIKGTHYTGIKLEQSRTTGQATSTPLSIKTTDSFVTDISMGINGVSASVLSKRLGFTVDTTAWGMGRDKVSLDWDIALNRASVAGSHAAVAASGLPNLHLAANDSTVHAYMRLETTNGQSLAGFSTASGYENWIEVTSPGWSLTAASSGVSGSGAGVGKAAPTAFSWTQGIDATLPLNIMSIANGTSLGKVVIEYVRTQAGGAPVTFMQQVLHDAFFSDIALADGVVSESVVFKSFDQTLWAVDGTTGARGRASGFSYNVPGNSFTAGTPITTTSATRFGTGLLDGDWAHSAIAHTAGSMGELTPGPVVNVPEPQSWALMLAGGAMLAALARRRGARRS